MDSREILSLYEWTPGLCFRHPSRGEVDTTPVSTLHPRNDGALEVRACRDCVVEMEGVRRRAAEKAGVPYEAGHVAHPLRGRKR
ncbi:hypothetical protein [Streptomyces sp. SDr-06]|uniref:hypothetical protein n=1 Tax=Streptomyces sp. SDr-06 TaxID=2267702 RepID=UPI001673678A|nr:hypothetical protein [Streptomyces sp. SDr-06]